jgi:uncharacterized protein (UPF0276 family)
MWRASMLSRGFSALSTRTDCNIGLGISDVVVNAVNIKMSIIPDEEHHQFSQKQPDRPKSR